MDSISFETHPSRYRHWKLRLPEGGDLPAGVAELLLSVDESAPLRPGYTLKLNSYDLSVDIELADAVERLRFEHPEIGAVIVGSAKDRIFCAGANIHMLASSSHPFKVNFCKYTNETRLYIENASQHSGQKYLAACSGPTAGGGYELALACDEIFLIDDGSSTVSLPEVPLLGVLPGTGGLTRVVDKRHVRRDLADVFSTLAEGVKGKRAVLWKLVDQTVSRSKFMPAVRARAQELGKERKPEKSIVLDALLPEISETTIRYRHVNLLLDEKARTATLTVHAPTEAVTALDQILKAGANWWPLRAFRELDDALLRLRFAHEKIGLLVLKTRGDAKNILACDQAIATNEANWFVREVRLKMARVLRRLDQSARSLFAILDSESCFAGSLLEIALAADRRYALDDSAHPIYLQASQLNTQFLTANGRTRLDLLGAADKLTQLIEAPCDAAGADELGLITVLSDEIDFADTLRLAIEERAALSPDALTGMEASFRCIGPETLESKIFGRLSSWQNWIFSRPNAIGQTGALTLYGQPERPSFDWRRT